MGKRSCSDRFYFFVLLCHALYRFYLGNMNNCHETGSRGFASAAGFSLSRKKDCKPWYSSRKLLIRAMRSHWIRLSITTTPLCIPISTVQIMFGKNRNVQNS